MKIRLAGGCPALCSRQSSTSALDSSRDAHRAHQQPRQARVPRVHGARPPLALRARRPAPPWRSPPPAQPLGGRAAARAPGPRRHGSPTPPPPERARGHPGAEAPPPGQAPHAPPNLELCAPSDPGLRAPAAASHPIPPRSVSVSTAPPATLPSLPPVSPLLALLALPLCLPLHFLSLSPLLCFLSHPAVLARLSVAPLTSFLLPSCSSLSSRLAHSRIWLLLSQKFPAERASAWHTHSERTSPEGSGAG